METWYCSHGHKFNHPDVSFWDETYYRCPICRTHQIKEHDSKPKIISKCFKCNDCRLVFSIPKEIQKHGLKICVCPRCENEMI